MGAADCTGTADQQEFLASAGLVVVGNRSRCLLPTVGRRQRALALHLLDRRLQPAVHLSGVRDVPCVHAAIAVPVDTQRRLSTSIPSLPSNAVLLMGAATVAVVLIISKANPELLEIIWSGRRMKR